MNKMNRYIYIFLAFIVITLAVFLGFRNLDGQMATNAVSAERKQESKQEEVVVSKDPKLAEKRQKLLKDTSGDYFYGKQFAPVVMIEYASLSCPHCAYFHEKVVEPMTPTYIDTGKVKYVYRDFPLNAPALAASKLARCADGDKYFSFLKVLFKSQEQWAMPGTDYKNVLQNIGKLGGVSEEKFAQCQQDKAMEEKIFKAQQEANEILEVSSTPTIFINGIKYEGKHEYKDVAEYIDKLLKGE